MKLSLTIHDRLDPCLEAALSPNADDPPEILDSRDLIPMPVRTRRSIPPSVLTEANTVHLSVPGTVR